jgi:nicotinate phosphoribosyltransferase
MVTSESLLLTDFYQLTMLQAYHAQGMNDTAVFEFFARKLPENRNFLLAAGLEQVVEYLENLHFTAKELDWLADCGHFGRDFVDSLAGLRFTGEVHAMPEGTVCFPDEPILRVVAPIREAQLVESRLINLLQFQTMIASKAARSVLAAPGKLLVDFGLRRAHGAEAGLLSARASYIAGFSGTATVLAGVRWGIPLYGTMAHSFIQAHSHELEAFAHFARAHPRNCVLLIDTYDTEAAAAKLIDLARTLAEDGIRIKAVRIDSGDLGEHARRVRDILDQGGLQEVNIFASSSLDEYKLRELAATAPIDGFGVGTRMNTSADKPYLDCAYKLQEYAGEPRRKRSEGKATWPGRKQVYRRANPAGRFVEDLLTTADDVRSGLPLLSQVMKEGRRLGPLPTLDEIREYAAAQMMALPEHLRALDPAPAYPVTISERLMELARIVDARTGAPQR